LCRKKKKVSTSSNRVFNGIMIVLMIVIIILAGISVYFAVSINDKLAGTTATTEKPSITVYALWSGTEEYNFRQALGNFTELTGINVTYYGYTTQDLLISVPLQLRAPPYSVDVIAAPWPYWINSLQAYLNPVNSQINETDYPANIVAPVKDTSGNIWAAPFKLSGKPGWWYRPSFFAANNLQVPTTYDEFNNTLLPAIQAIPGVEAAMASGDTDGWPLSDQTEGFLMGLGDYQLELNLETGPSKVNWTDPVVRNIMGNMTQLIQAGYFSTPAAWEDQVAKLWSGDYGIYWQGSFITTLPEVQNVSDFAFFGFPETTGVVGSIDYLVLPKYAPHPTEAQQLINYLAGPDAQTIMVKQGGFLGTNKNVPVSAYRPIDKTVVDFMASPGINIVPDLDDTIGGIWQTTFWDQLKLLWTDPSQLDNVLNTLQTISIQQQGT
jgi:multiple sugar transport system substrate-binding protein